MNDRRFDDVARRLVERRPSRRGLLGGLSLALLAPLAVPGEAEARRCPKNKKRCRGKCIRKNRCCGDGDCRTGFICKRRCIRCGDIGRPCCKGLSCDAGAVCRTSRCRACGDLTQPCCSGQSCDPPFTCSGGTCEAL